MSQYTDLLALQDTDTTLDQLRHRRTALPERAAVAAAVGMVASVDRRLADAEQVYGELSTQLVAREAEAAVLTRKLADLGKKSSISTVAKEAEALQHEIGTVNAQRSVIEDTELDLMGQLEPVESSRDGLLAERPGLVDDLARRRSELEAAEATIDAEAAALAPLRASTSASVSPELLTRYEKLRARFKGIAIARVEHGVCGGCRMKVANTQMEALRSMSADSVGECEECGRLLMLS